MVLERRRKVWRGKKVEREKNLRDVFSARDDTDTKSPEDRGRVSDDRFWGGNEDFPDDEKKASLNIGFWGAP